MSWILLTNDDGVDSPALAPFAAALAELAEVRVCVPRGERSWIAKAMTRFDEVQVEQRPPLAGSVATWTVSGTPADAANVGIHTMADTPPAMVVSGINVGSNVGSAFLLSSGTVGAAWEGWSAGIDAWAFSTRSATQPWGTWVREATGPDAGAGWEHVAGVCTGILRDLRETAIQAAADVVSVNLPWEATHATPRVVTSVARTDYGSVFPDRGSTARRFRFDGTLVRRGDEVAADLDVLDRGEVSITPLLAPAAARLDDDLRARIERG